MSNFIESKQDGTLVQQFIWDKLEFDWNEFTGIEGFTKAELLTLKSLIERELHKDK